MVFHIELVLREESKAEDKVQGEDLVSLADFQIKEVEFSGGPKSTNGSKDFTISDGDKPEAT